MKDFQLFELLCNVYQHVKANRNNFGKAKRTSLGQGTSGKWEEIVEVFILH